MKLPKTNIEKQRYFKKVMTIARRLSGYKDYDEFFNILCAQFRPHYFTNLKCALIDAVHEQITIAKISECLNCSRKTVHIMLGKSRRKTKFNNNIYLDKIHKKLTYGKVKHIRPNELAVVSASAETSDSEI